MPELPLSGLGGGEPALLGEARPPPPELGEESGAGLAPRVTH